MHVVNQIQAQLVREISPSAMIADFAFMAFASAWTGLMTDPPACPARLGLFRHHVCIHQKILRRFQNVRICWLSWLGEQASDGNCYVFNDQSEYYTREEAVALCGSYGYIMLEVRTQLQFDALVPVHHAQGYGEVHQGIVWNAATPG